VSDRRTGGPPVTNIRNTSLPHWREVSDIAIDDAEERGDGGLIGVIE